MTKRDLVVKISSKTGIIQKDVYTVIQKTLDYIVESLVAGRHVELRNFGVFEPCRRGARVGRNPHKPQKPIPIPARTVIRFKPGKSMRRKVARV
jgi:nucleoid DNA-binding protein